MCVRVDIIWIFLSASKVQVISITSSSSHNKQFMTLSNSENCFWPLPWNFGLARKPKCLDMQIHLECDAQLRHWEVQHGEDTSSIYSSMFSILLFLMSPVPQPRSISPFHFGASLVVRLSSLFSFKTCFGVTCVTVAWFSSLRPHRRNHIFLPRITSLIFEDSRPSFTGLLLLWPDLLGSFNCFLSGCGF